MSKVPLPQWEKKGGVNSPGTTTQRHSSIVEGDNDKFVIHQNKFCGKTQTYLPGVINPAFTGMILWEIQHSHLLNDYKISRYHNVKSGIIIIGTKA